jgi:hypothetical protein
MENETFEYTCPKCHKEWNSKISLGWGSHVCEPCFEIINADRKAERDAKAAKKQKKEKLPEVANV